MNRYVSLIEKPDVVWVRRLTIAVLLLTAFWPLLIFQVIAACIIKINELVDKTLGQFYWDIIYWVEGKYIRSRKKYRDELESITGGKEN